MSQNSVAVEGDLRVRRTQKMLHDAFIALVIDKGFESITVQMLAEEAMINRATFYRHYQDKYELAERVCATLTAEYQESLRAKLPETLSSGGELLFAHIARYGDFYQALLAGMPNFRETMCRNIEQELHALYVQMGLDEERLTLPLPLILRYLATAQMGIIQWWLEAGQPLSTTEMAAHLMHLHLHGATQALQLPALSA